MRNFLLALASLLLVSGCAVVYKQPIYQGNLIREQSVTQLRVGQSKSQVAGLLGTPSVADPFHTQRWDYTASQRLGRSGKTQVRNFTVYFENDRVVRWEGNYFPNQDAELARNSGKQFGRNLGRNRRR